MLMILSLFTWTTSWCLTVLGKNILIVLKKCSETLRQYQLHLNLKKRKFGKTALLYPDYVVGDGELKFDSYKVRAITN